MRIKKGFTLAEILIVLMVIGVIATMTIPSLMKGVTEAQFKTGYRKAFNTIVNLAAIEKINGSLPAKASVEGANAFWEAMNENLSVKGYGDGTKCGADHGIDQANCGMLYKATSPSKNEYGDGATATSDSVPSTSAIANWIVTDDGFAYSLFLGGAGEAVCKTKAQINAVAAGTDPNTSACLAVIVDVNGLGKGPNLLERQEVTTTTGPATNSLTADASAKKLKTLVGDQYIIYLGSDGATAGPADSTITGKIISDKK